MNYDPKDERTEWRSDRDKPVEQPEEIQVEVEPVTDGESAAAQPEQPEIIEAELVEDGADAGDDAAEQAPAEEPCEPVEEPVTVEAEPQPEPQPQPEGPTKAEKRSSGVFVGVLVGLLCIVLLGTAAAVISALAGGRPALPGDSRPATQSRPSANSAPGVTLDDLITLENKDNLAPKDAYQKILPSVVIIKCFESMNAASYGEATGFVISEDGYILTNEHVIVDAAIVTVTTVDQKTYQATVVAKDAETDLAVIKIEAKGLTVAEFASSDQTEVGQFVMAVGNPTGSELSNSATFGILSGKSRISSSDAYISLMQVDAAINPGNSGGPLINLAGQVIGVVSSKVAGVNYEGIGFAIPSDETMEIVRDLLQYGYVKGRVRMGVTIVELTAAEVVSNNLPGNVAVYEVNADSDAAKQGLRVNDIITAINGETVTSSAQLISTIRTFEPGDKVTLSVYRRNGGVTENLTITVELHEYVSN
ncbi:MAG: trypsin-like peptidase domain-containing protein [Clostridia bacterium]|nr:trypsin-like peptidase domain-containing protein [Clostridia bacterium]